MAAGMDNLIILSNDVSKQVYENQDVDTKKSNATEYKIGMKEFEAWMRMLDAQVSKFFLWLGLNLKP